MNIIEIINVSKQFKIYDDKKITLKEKILFRHKEYYKKIQALDKVNLAIEKGSVVGLIGKNGSGKSTILKLLTRIIYPDQGKIIIKGKVSSLLELGAGFHPDMTGKENIYMNASIFGLTKKEIDEKLDTIIAFSELNEFIDFPVRTYSSGMYMRLAFAVAINVNADILLIDEILAVGDSSFQAKCFRKMQELKEYGTTIVIVSHDLTSIERLCNRTVWIDQGKIKRIGNTLEINREYIEFMTPIKQIERVSYSNTIETNQKIKLRNTKVLNKNNIVTKEFKTGDTIKIIFDYINEDEIKDVVLGFNLFRKDGINFYGTNTKTDGIEKVCLKKEGTIELIFNNIGLLEGTYIIDITVFGENGQPYNISSGCLEISIKSVAEEVGIYRLNHKWIFDN